MLCIDCKKNTAIVFINQSDNAGNQKRIGFCYSCAKKRGIDPLKTLGLSTGGNPNGADMSEQLGSMISDLENNIKNIAKNQKQKSKKRNL